MRSLWFAGAAAVMVVLVAPWLMATFDFASYDQDFLSAVHPATGSAPDAQQLAELAEQLATRHGIVAHAAVTVSDPRLDNPSKPDDPDNRVQDVVIDIALEKKLLVGSKRARNTYKLALGGKGSANSWPPPSP
jgi:hypothetical protein